MALSGVDPSNPRPALRREFIFAAGASSGIAPSRPMLLMGNNVAAGSEADDLIGDPLVDDADARARLGLRSEAYAMYRQVTAVPQDLTIYVVCPTESAGAASACSFKVVGVSDASTTWEFDIHGEKVQYSAQSGDTAQTTSEGIRDKVNGADEGRLQVVATSLIDGAGPSYDMTLTASQNGPRGDLITGQAATRGCRVKVLSGPGNTQAIAKTVGDFVAGGAADDMTAAIVEMSNGEYYYQATAGHQVIALTATDNGVGEHLTAINTQALPINGKDQRLFAGLVGTQAEATTVVTGAGGNSVYGHFFRQENSDWTPAMLAAHHCAIVRQQEIAHPAANINGWTASTNQIYNVPPPFLKADYPTNAEIVADLNNGVSPISFVGGRVVLERFITSRSLNTSANSDYRAREGHIPSVMHFVWSFLKQRYESIRQPFADDDPVGTNPPPARTMIPSTIVAMIENLINDFTGSAPVQGTYSGPILKPSAAQEMKDSINVVYAGGGSFPTAINFQAVEHDIKWEVTLREVSDAY